jgi:hypothetical protein
MAEQSAGTPPGGDAEGRLQEALARSPELATMMAARPPRRWRGRLRWFAFAAGLAGAGLVVGLAGRRGPATTEDAAEVPRETVLPPLTASRDPASGEEVAPFSGFAVQIETEPTGALVEVAGVARGEAPVFAGVDCRPGETVEVRAEERGAGRARAAVRCRADALVKLTLRLGR